jgi:5-methylthioadenosine/S-adenosylhomocysteine deaminase
VVRPTLLCARWLVVSASEVLPEAALWIEHGRVARVLTSASAQRVAARSGPTVLHFEGTLTAGLVNAHAHLELGWLRGRLRRGTSMPVWISDLLRLRRALDSAEAVRLAAVARSRGLQELAANGCTCVADIDSSGGTRALLIASRWRGVAYGEVLDAGRAERTAAALASAARTVQQRTTPLVRVGISPHAPYTTSPALLAGLGALLARRPRHPIAVHWAEFAAEREWLEEGRGPLARLLPHAPRRSGLALLRSAGLLRASTLLIHANDALPAERAEIARSGATVVHCPGSHAWFRRAAFDLRAWRKAGVRVVLGTDSLASHTRLDMRAELAALRLSQPDLSASEAWEMATTAGAHALGGAPQAGTLLPGAAADWATFDLAPLRRRDVLERLTLESPGVLEVRCAHRKLHVRASTLLQDTGELA